MFRSKAYLEFIKTLPCVVCGREAGEYLSVVPAHQKLGEGGIGIKPPDTHCLPLCHYCHTHEHRGERTFWQGVNINRERIIIKCLTLYLEKIKSK
ncbi:DUF968 domain-containing protein [Candidatus Pacearchaeota archaeon]|nr:DUF968 domain-containing protein [Candidatus Pacearchaeota archaeon]